MLIFNVNNKFLKIIAIALIMIVREEYMVYVVGLIDVFVTLRHGILRIVTNVTSKIVLFYSLPG